jgi:uncharacterized damage-inducible protein DinB
MNEDLKYPIGQYQVQPFSESLKEEWMTDIKFFPNVLESLVQDLDEEQLNTPYREGGWTVHQLVHHMADSHMNAYIRFKLGYTEDNPVIKPYDEKAWAELADVNILPVNLSITLLYALHLRWFQFLVSLEGKDWERTVFHPEQKKQISLWDLLGMYAWHGRHHAAHIRKLRERMSF